MFFFSTFVNALLKTIWKVELSETVYKKDWYAFPSGHMQASTFLYFAICILIFFSKMPKRYFYSSVLLSSLILYFYAQAMIYFKFHNWVDVAGGYFMGLFMSGLFAFIYCNLKSQYYKLGALFIIMEVIILCTLPQAKHCYLWLHCILSCTIGTTAGIFFLERSKRIIEHKSYNLFTNIAGGLCLIVAFYSNVIFHRILYGAELLSISDMLLSFFLIFVVPYLLCKSDDLIKDSNKKISSGVKP